MNGWVKNHRSIKLWGWYKKPLTAHLFQHLIREANYQDGEWMGHRVQRGQLITGRKALSSATGLTEQQVRTALKHLQTCHEVATKSTKTFTIITICNYDKYQGEDLDDQPRINQEVTKNQPRGNQEITTNKKERREEGKNNTAAAAKEKRVAGIAIVKEMQPAWWTADEWQELIDHRRSVKATQSVRAYNALLKEFEIAHAAGDTPQDILDDITQGKGWAGYKWEWVCNRRGGTCQNRNATAANTSAKVKQVIGGLCEKDYNAGATEREKLPDCLKA